eukprot:664235-Rhodomonas_salina.1
MLIWTMQLLRMLLLMLALTLSLLLLLRLLLLLLLLLSLLMLSAGFVPRTGALRACSRRESYGGNKTLAQHSPPPAPTTVATAVQTSHQP